jgi:hypothetical protein
MLYLIHCKQFVCANVPRAFLCIWCLIIRFMPCTYSICTPVTVHIFFWEINHCSTNCMHSCLSAPVKILPTSQTKMKLHLEGFLLKYFIQSSFHRLLGHSLIFSIILSGKKQQESGENIRSYGFGVFWRDNAMRFLTEEFFPLISFSLLSIITFF